jgi:hypothetical protein
MHTSFGRDPFVQGAHRMLASSDPLQAKLLSMYLGQVQMVARGEDLRKRTIRDLGTRNLACVGECCNQHPLYPLRQQRCEESSL